MCIEVGAQQFSTFGSSNEQVKYGVLVIVVFVLLIVVGGVIFLNGPRKDEIYDQREIANENFKMRITAYREIGVLLPGVYFVFQSAPVESDKWQNVLIVKGDEPIPIKQQQLAFAGPHVGYGFISSYCIVTTNAGKNWSIWDGHQLLDRANRKATNLSPYIEDIQILADGTGRMRLLKYFTERERGPDLLTSDYGFSWYLKK